MSIAAVLVVDGPSPQSAVVGVAIVIAGFLFVTPLAYKWYKRASDQRKRDAVIFYLGLLCGFFFVAFYYEAFLPFTVWLTKVLF